MRARRRNPGGPGWGWATVLGLAGFGVGFTVAAYGAGRALDAAAKENEELKKRALPPPPDGIPPFLPGF